MTFELSPGGDGICTEYRWRRVCLVDRMAGAKTLRWEKAQQIGGTREDGCGFTYGVRSWNPHAQAPVHSSGAAVSRQGVSCPGGRSFPWPNQRSGRLLYMSTLLYSWAEVPTSTNPATPPLPHCNSLGAKAAPGPQPKGEVLKLQGEAEWMKAEWRKIPAPDSVGWAGFVH